MSEGAGGWPLHGIGHNMGPSMDAGRTWRAHSWARAQAQHKQSALPVALLRMRMARAADVGLAYRDYASVRATSGRDIAGYLISSNALQVFSNGAPVPEEISEKLIRLRHVHRIALAQPPLSPELLMDCVRGLDAAVPAPPLLASFPRMREALARAQQGLPAAGLVAITALGLEKEWVAAGRLGAALPAEALFGAA